MRSVRFIVSIITILLLSAGYAASQIEYFNGNVSAYVAKVDQPPIRLAATLLLLTAIVFALIPEREQQDKT